MKKYLFFLILLFVTTFSVFKAEAAGDPLTNINTSLSQIYAETHPQVVYFYTSGASVNQDMSPYITELTNEGIKVSQFDINNNPDNQTLMYSFSLPYGVTMGISLYEQNLSAVTPLLFAGDSYYLGKDAIANAMDTIGQKAKDPLLTVTARSIPANPLTAELNELNQVKAPRIVYFYSPSCSECQDTDKNYLSKLNPDITINYYDITFDVNNKNLMYSFSEAYGVPMQKSIFGISMSQSSVLPTTPLIFAGQAYYHGESEVAAAFNSGALQQNAENHIKTVTALDVPVQNYQGILSFLIVLVAGLIDGVNPCAMAMLLLFISLLIGFSAKKRTLIAISTSYIFGLFLTYFALGTVLLRFIDVLSSAIRNLQIIIYVFAAVLSLFLFIFNLYDYIVSRKEEYGKVKNQLPKGIQRFNKQIIKFFAQSLTDKKIYLVYALTFILGVIISVTEFLCTGQVYLPTILLISQNNTGLGRYLFLLLYNIMFIVPLTALAVFAVGMQSATSASNKIREMLHWIKLVTAILFLCIAVYFIFKLI